MNINQVVYPQGESRPVIDLDVLVTLLTEEQVVYLNAKIAGKLMENLND